MAHSKKILFASYHSILDASSGAAISANALLEMLAAHHWDVRVLCGPLCDAAQRPDVRQGLLERGISFQTTALRHNAVSFELLGYRSNGVSGAIFLPENKAFQPPTEIADAFLHLYQSMLEDWKPDVLLTYGGQEFMPFLAQWAQARCIRTVFWLRNFAYSDADFFRSFDGVIVPSCFAAEHYAKLGISATPIPSLMDEAKIRVSRDSQKKYVTFVNPQPHKGLFVFARIAQILGRSRPDIPLLVVESRGHADWLRQSGLDFSGVSSIASMPNTPNPRDFYNVTRIMLMPSLWWESFGRIPAEAMLNGIPVLASNRGALPETCGQSGFLFDVPTQYTPQTREPITEKEAAPWVETILRLWDDAAFYEEASKKSRHHAKRWDSASLFAEYEKFFDFLLTKY